MQRRAVGRIQAQALESGTERAAVGFVRCSICMAKCDGRHNGKHFGDFPAEGEDMALLCLDECSSNTCSFYFWRDRCEIMIEAVWDDSHRRKHDVETVIHEAGYGVVVAKAHIRNNFSCGPWQGKGYLKYMEEDAADTKGFACKDFAFSGACVRGPRRDHWRNPRFCSQGKGGSTVLGGLRPPNITKDRALKCHCYVCCHIRDVVQDIQENGPQH